MKIFYRISNNSYDKTKLPNASKEACFANFIQNVLQPSDELIVIADSVNDELLSFLKGALPANGQIIETATGSNTKSFQYQLELVRALAEAEIVFFQEDDYLYQPHAGDTPDIKFNHLLIEEGLGKADYVSLYDHPDKYIPYSQKGNPSIGEDGVEYTGLFATAHSHWKFTNSTTLTFAIRAKSLQDDIGIWNKWCEYSHPQDYYAFMDLKAKGRTVATPIPGRCTHTVDQWLSPLFDWRSL